VRTLIFCVAFGAAAVVNTIPASAETSTCTADQDARLGKEQPAPPDEEPGDKELPYEKMFKLEVDGGLYTHRRWCADTIQIPDTTEYSINGKVRGYFRHRDYWEGRDLELRDDQGRVRILKLNVTDAFERVMIFDDVGQLVAPLNSVKGPSATAVILDELAKERLDPGTVMLWLLHYHGEGDGADNKAVFAGWLNTNKEAGLKFATFLGPKTGRVLASGASIPLRENPKAKDKFKVLYTKGASPMTDEIWKLLDSMP
jgi:hypothetical protein